MCISFGEKRANFCGDSGDEVIGNRFAVAQSIVARTGVPNLKTHQSFLGYSDLRQDRSATDARATSSDNHSIAGSGNSSETYFLYINIRYLKYI